MRFENVGDATSHATSARKHSACVDQTVGVVFLLQADQALDVVSPHLMAQRIWLYVVRVVAQGSRSAGVGTIGLVSTKMRGALRAGQLEKGRIRRLRCTVGRLLRPRGVKESLVAHVTVRPRGVFAGSWQVSVEPGKHVLEYPRCRGRKVSLSQHPLDVRAELSVNGVEIGFADAGYLRAPEAAPPAAGKEGVAKGGEVCVRYRRRGRRLEL